jgi:hypothetical protein
LDRLLEREEEVEEDERLFVVSPSGSRRRLSSVDTLELLIFALMTSKNLINIRFKEANDGKEGGEGRWGPLKGLRFTHVRPTKSECLLPNLE